MPVYVHSKSKSLKGFKRESPRIKIQHTFKSNEVAAFLRTSVESKLLGLL